MHDALWSQYLIQPAEKYLVVITKVQRLGHVFHRAIYMIEQVLCLAFDAEKAKEKLESKARLLSMKTLKHMFRCVNMLDQVTTSHYR